MKRILRKPFPVILLILGLVLSNLIVMNLGISFEMNGGNTEETINTEYFRYSLSALCKLNDVDSLADYDGDGKYSGEENVRFMYEYQDYAANLLEELQSLSFNSYIYSWPDIAGAMMRCTAGLPILS